MGCSKSSSKREVYSITVLSQETGKTLKKQPNFTPKTTRRRKKKKNPTKLVEEISMIWAEINEKEMKETVVKINKTKSWFFEKINKIDIKIKKREESNKQN